METNTDFEPKEVVVLVNEARIPEKDIFGEPERDGGAVKPEPVVQKNDEQNEAVELLRQQLAEKQREADEAKRLRAQAEAYAREKDVEVKQLSVHAQDNQHTAFINAIASFERDAEMLENEYANRLANGDYQAAAKIQRQMAQVEGRLSQLQQGKEALEVRLEEARREPVRQTQPEYTYQQRDPVEESLSKLTPSSRAWVQNHPEVLSDAESNARMTAAHHSAIKNNIRPDSSEYFAHLDREMGYAKRQTNTRQQKVVTAAPVSRGGTVNYQSGGQVAVTLTPEQRAYAAEVLGVTDEEYADGMLYYANKGKLQI
jgi:hypothetical protein